MWCHPKDSLKALTWHGCNTTIWVNKSRSGKRRRSWVGFLQKATTTVHRWNTYKVKWTNVLKPELLMEIRFTLFRTVLHGLQQSWEEVVSAEFVGISDFKLKLKDTTLWNVRQQNARMMKYDEMKKHLQAESQSGCFLIFKQSKPSSNFYVVCTLYLPLTCCLSCSISVNTKKWIILKFRAECMLI